MSDVVVQGVTAEQVRGSVERTKRGLEAAAAEIVWQISVRAWEPLGYESWDEMREAEYSGAAVIVPRADRPQLSARLAAEGLSQKQIGETLGVGQATVSRDLADVIQMNNEDQPATRTDALGREQPRVKVRRDPDPEPEPEPDGPDHDDKRPDPEPGIWYSGPARPAPDEPNPIAAAVKEARTAPSHIAGKAVDEIKLVGDIIARAGGVDAILADLDDNTLDDTIAELWLSLIDPVTDQLDQWRSGLRRRRLRSVQ